MCAIVGLIDHNQRAISTVILERMRDTMVHRGPDGKGSWVENNIGFGHRRLSIVDLSSAGQQPMVSVNGRFVLTYNGELYNFRELRAELQRLGHRFHSDCDSEVVLNALVEWREEALNKFNGMFALGFYDRQTGDLLLARDRYGIKPLYLYEDEHYFAFSSEQRAFSQIPGFQPQLCYTALKEYFTFQNIFSNNTLLKGISVLPAGFFLTTNVKTKQTTHKTSQYWDFVFEESTQKPTLDEYQEEVSRLLHQSINRQLVADVEVGSYLSGGIDSGLIVAIASQTYSHMKTFTCGFDLSSASGLEQAFDERCAAEHMSYLFKTEQYEMVLKAGDMQRSLPKLAAHLEEPRVGQSYPNLHAAKLASKFVKVCLSGVGGDEIFAGYPWRYATAMDCSTESEFRERYFTQWQRLLSGEQLDALFSPIHNCVKDFSPQESFDAVLNGFKRSGDANNLQRALYFDAKSFLPGLLHVEDKLSMAFGLEVRVPFLDNDLVDFAIQTPSHYLVDRSHDDIAFGGKQLLRKCASRYMPDRIVNARKQGFSAPDSSWFKGESMHFVQQQLLKNESPIFDVLDRSLIHCTVNEHLAGKRNHRLLIWSLLNFNEWFTQIFSDKQSQVL